MIGLDTAPMQVLAFEVSALPMVIGLMYRHMHRIKPNMIAAKALTLEIIRGTQAESRRLHR
jgi:hypothetical protein